MLPPTGADALVDGQAVGRRGPGLRGSADGSEAEVVEASGVHPPQDAAAGGAAVVRVDDGQLVLRRPLQVEVVIVGGDGAAPGDLQGGVGHPPVQEGGRRFGS